MDFDKNTLKHFKNEMDINNMQENQTIYIALPRNDEINTIETPSDCPIEISGTV
jgi:hypothetical protein